MWMMHVPCRRVMAHVNASYPEIYWVGWVNLRHPRAGSEHVQSMYSGAHKSLFPGPRGVCVESREGSYLWGSMRGKSLMRDQIWNEWSETTHCNELQQWVFSGFHIQQVQYTATSCNIVQHITSDLVTNGIWHEHLSEADLVKLTNS